MARMSNPSVKYSNVLVIPGESVSYNNAGSKVVTIRHCELGNVAPGTKMMVEFLHHDNTKVIVSVRKALKREIVDRENRRVSNDETCRMYTVTKDQRLFATLP